MERVVMGTQVSHTELKEGNTYDVAAVRIQALSDCGNQLSYYQEPIQLQTSGSLALIGPSVVSLKGGAGGTYVKTIGEAGQGTLMISGESFAPVTIAFTVTKA
jgi:beta-galactosidase